MINEVGDAVRVIVNFWMKDVRGIFWLLGLVACGCICGWPAQAYGRDLLYPYFVASNTGKIEVKRIELTPERTLMEVWFYGNPGEEVGISSNTVLKTAGGELGLRSAERVPVDGKTEPERIGGTGKHLAVLCFPPVPAGVYSVDLVEKEAGWKIRGIQLVDKEPYVYVPDFLQPGGEGERDEVPVPAFLPGRTVVNGYILGYEPDMDLKASLCLEDWLTESGERLPVKIRKDGSFSVETDLLMAVGAELHLQQGVMDLWLMPGEELTVYVHLPRWSMSACRGGKHRVDNVWKVLCVGKAAAWSNMRADGMRNVELRKEWGSRLVSDYQKDFAVAGEVYRSLLAKGRLEVGEKKKINDIVCPEIREYVRLKGKRLAENWEKARRSGGYVVARLDDSVKQEDILPAIVAGCHGRAVLVDVWATWCGPCRKSMRVLRVLKRKLLSEEISYIYVTGPSSPEEEWRSMIGEMTGIHYRLTESQWEYLCRSYGITGIPAYLLVDREGKCLDCYVGFPGVEVLTGGIMRALE